MYSNFIPRLSLDLELNFYKFSKIKIEYITFFI